MTTLEKIRAEIEQIKPYDLPCDKRTPEHIKDMAIEIIDKYETKLEPTEECEHDCEHCAYLECPKEPSECQWYEKEDNICWNEDKPFIECPKEPTTLKQIIEKHNMDKLAYDEMSDFERDVLKYAEQEPTSPCDLCRFNPQINADEKPCAMCSAEKRR